MTENNTSSDMSFLKDSPSDICVKKDIYIGTGGVAFQCSNCFYPEGMDPIDYLKYYSSKFNSVFLGCDSEGKCPESKYLIEQVAGNPNFKFLIELPISFSSANVKNARKIWEQFWDECVHLHDAKVLGCIVIPFDTKFICDQKHIRKLAKICKKIPTTVNIVLDFRHWTWWETDESEFIQSPNWCMVTSYLENEMVDSGWARTIPSTRIRSIRNKMPISISKNFACISLYGTLGPELGSYDEHRFLEEFAVKLRDIRDSNVDIYVIFLNGQTTFSFQLPPLIIGGQLCHPQTKILSPLICDQPSSLHDAVKLQNLIEKQSQSKYQIGDNGYVKIFFRKLKNEL